MLLVVLPSLAVLIFCLFPNLTAQPKIAAQDCVGTPDCVQMPDCDIWGSPMIVLKGPRIVLKGHYPPLPKLGDSASLLAGRDQFPVGSLVGTFQELLDGEPKGVRVATDEFTSVFARGPFLDEIADQDNQKGFGYFEGFHTGPLVFPLTTENAWWLPAPFLPDAKPPVVEESVEPEEEVQAPVFPGGFRIFFQTREPPSRFLVRLKRPLVNLKPQLPASTLKISDTLWQFATHTTVKLTFDFEAPPIDGFEYFGLEMGTWF